MSLRSSRVLVVGLLATVCCVLALLSCRHSPSAPGGQLLVHVTAFAGGPAPDKKIEIVGTALNRVTNWEGQARFLLPAGSYVVRAYVGVPGPRGFAEKSVVVEPAGESRAEFFDCTACR